MTMGTADLNRIYDNATVALPGSLLGAIQMELFNVLDDFCRYTNVWQEWIDFSVNPSTTAVNGSIDIVCTTGQIVRLLATVDANRKIKAADMLIPGTLRMREIPGSTETWTAIVSKSVENKVSTAKNVPDAPDWLLPQYRDAIFHGLLGKMMVHPAKPYTNAQMGSVHLRKFSQLMNQARTEVSHKNLYGANTWSFPQASMPSRPNRV